MLKLIRKGEIRNTPMTCMSYQPAYKLTNHRLNSNVPTLPARLDPNVIDPQPQLEQRQRQHKVFDGGARELSTRQAADDGRMRHNAVWKPEIIIVVERDATTYQRNRRDLMMTAEVVPRDVIDEPTDDLVADGPTDDLVADGPTDDLVVDEPHTTWSSTLHRPREPTTSVSPPTRVVNSEAETRTSRLVTSRH